QPPTGGRISDIRVELVRQPPSARNWIQFVVPTLRTIISWPAVVVVVAFLFHSDIARLLDRVGSGSVTVGSTKLEAVMAQTVLAKDRTSETPGEAPAEALLRPWSTHRSAPMRSAHSQPRGRSRLLRDGPSLVSTWNSRAVRAKESGPDQRYSL